MKYKTKKQMRGFTLIELIAVLVILAIIALIATPLVMNIVKKAKESANKRSVDAYGKAVELGVATHLLDTGDYPISLDNLTIEYTGNEVVCNVKTLNEDGSIYLSECSVKGTEVKDSGTEDGWYHYGKMISNEITYQAYNIGDTVTYNGMEFYVIEASDKNRDRVTMLKAEPLTVDEVNTYGGIGTENNHVNMYIDPTSPVYKKTCDLNGYGSLAYYTNSMCGYAMDGTYSNDSCLTDYNQSEVKYVVDAWASDKFLNGILVEDITGYSVRLISFDDLINNLGYIIEDGMSFMSLTENTPNWIYSGSYNYWVMSLYEYSDDSVWNVGNHGYVTGMEVRNGSGGVIRPVVTILKSSI